MTYSINSKKWRITNWQDNQHKIAFSNQASRTFFCHSGLVVSDVSKEQPTQLHVPLHLNPPQHHWGNLKPDILHTRKISDSHSCIAKNSVLLRRDAMLLGVLIPKCWRVPWPTSFRPLLEYLTPYNKTLPSCHLGASACPSTMPHVRRCESSAPSLEHLFFFPQPHGLKVAKAIIILVSISAPSFLILCVSYTNDTCLVFLLKALNSSQAGANVSGWCLWFLFCHPLKLVIYILLELMQQNCILQTVPSNLHWLLQGVVPVRQDTMQSWFVSVWYLSDRTQCSHDQCHCGTCQTEYNAVTSNVSVGLSNRTQCSQFSLTNPYRMLGCSHFMLS